MKREVKHQTEQRMLSQAAEEHAIPLVIGLEIHRVRMLVQTCASIPELHDLRWAPIGDLLPQPSGKSVVGPFPWFTKLAQHVLLERSVPVYDSCLIFAEAFARIRGGASALAPR